MKPVHFITQSVFSFGNDLLYCYWIKKKKRERETGLFSLKGNPGLATLGSLSSMNFPFNTFVIM